MSTKKRRTPVQQAMAALRERQGWTQAKLAEILQVQLPSVGRWEATEPPTGIALARLHRIAGQNGAAKLAKVFLRALEQEAETRPDTRALIDEIHLWSDLARTFADLAAEIRKLEKEQLKDSDLTNRIKIKALALQATYGTIRLLRWKEKFNELEKFDL
jgi:transcriptional regulator with XRE-family HTH domain